MHESTNGLIGGGGCGNRLRLHMDGQGILCLGLEHRQPLDSITPIDMVSSTNDTFGDLRTTTFASSQSILAAFLHFTMPKTFPDGVFASATAGRPDHRRQCLIGGLFP